MDVQFINWLAVIAAAVVGMVMGSVWYSTKVFGREWQKLNKLKDKDLGSPALAMGGAFLLLGGTGVVIDLLVGNGDLRYGLAVGFLIAAAVGSALGVLYAFENRPLKLYLINGGYLILTLAFQGAVIGWL